LTDALQLAGGFQVDHQLEFGGLLHGQIGGLCTFEDAAGVVAGLGKPQVGPTLTSPPIAVDSRPR
jgi:hypothetical protein